MSNAGSPSDADAPPASEDMDARISRLEMLMESILRRLDAPPVALAGGDEQLAALQEVAPMTLERRPGGDADEVRRDLGAAMASAARREGVSTRHDARPLAFEEAVIASSA
jgi:hypothetical protein